MVNKKILKIRSDLNKLDITLLNIIKKRSLLVNKVIKEKKYKNQIIDKKRILSILKRIKTQSVKMKIDPILTKRIWSSMIRAYIDYEFRNFKK
tara:strand:- start:31 stop:309 length:279 start_codon:yes stop_codon:yes gene_type:complete